jgi:hypothetical protein
MLEKGSSFSRVGDRLVASLETGIVVPFVVLRKLVAYRR